MKVIGVNNIFTTLMFLFNTLLGGYLFYFSFIEDDKIRDIPTLMYPFIIIACLFSLGVCIGVFFKYKIVMITDERISCFYPFILKKKQLKWKNLEETKWYTFYFGKTCYRRVDLKSENMVISLTDLEFENFNSLTNKIPKGTDLRKKIDIEQAKFEKPVITWFILILLCVGLFFSYQSIYSGNFLLFGFIVLFTVLLLYLLIKRRTRYSKILKKIDK
ncbi:MAG: hypothetical protein KGV59_04900 [Tenacibaculum sp.]|nr:hypothetical protein [Tenacibaculum sp.]